MAAQLIDLLSKEECTVHEVRSLLKSRPNIRTEINERAYGYFPLHVALFKRKSPQVITELLKNNADVNQRSAGVSPIMQVWFNDPSEGWEKEYYETIRILLKFGADVDGESKYNSPLRDLLLNKKNKLKSKFFIPTLELVIPFAQKSTKSSVLELLINCTLWRFPESEIALENSIQAVKLLLDAGAQPTLKWVELSALRCRQNSIFEKIFSKLFSELTASKEYKTSVVYEKLSGVGIAKLPFYAFDLFKVIVPYYMINYREVGSARVKMELDIEIAQWNRLCPNNDHHVSRMFSFFKDLWEDCELEFKRMENDVLTSNSSVLQILQQSYGLYTERIKVDAFDAYELIARLAKQEYPYFKDVLCHVIKNCDVKGLYILLNTERFWEANFPHPDIFYILTKYLGNKDLTNFLLACFQPTVNNTANMKLKHVSHLVCINKVLPIFEELDRVARINS